MLKSKPHIKRFGDKALLLEWEKEIAEEMHYHIMRVMDVIWDKMGEEVLEMVPAFHSLTVFVKPQVDVSGFSGRMEDIIEGKEYHPDIIKTITTIPVCYEAPFSLDIEELAHKKSISIPEFINLHTEPVYFVHFLGFLPGFPYLGGLNERLHYPRKKEPRSFISKGSVGIGGSQTGIYTSNSPGGWNIIGKSPVLFFDVSKASPALIWPGNYIKFENITQEEYRDIESLIVTGNYKLKKERSDD